MKNNYPCEKPLVLLYKCINQYNNARCLWHDKRCNIINLIFLLNKNILMQYLKLIIVQSSHIYEHNKYSLYKILL